MLLRGSRVSGRPSADAPAAASCHRAVLAASQRLRVYARVATLPVRIAGYELVGLEMPVAEDFTRLSTVVRLYGAGHEGVGEDTTYAPADQLSLRATGPRLALAGGWTVEPFSTHRARLDLFPTGPSLPDVRSFRAGRSRAQRSILPCGRRSSRCPTRSAARRSRDLRAVAGNREVGGAGEGAPQDVAVPVRQPTRASGDRGLGCHRARTDAEGDTTGGPSTTQKDVHRPRATGSPRRRKKHPLPADLTGPVSTSSRTVQVHELRRRDGDHNERLWFGAASAPGPDAAAARGTTGGAATPRDAWEQVEITNGCGNARGATGAGS